MSQARHNVIQYFFFFPWRWPTIIPLIHKIWAYNWQRQHVAICTVCCDVSHLSSCQRKWIRANDRLSSLIGHKHNTGVLQQTVSKVKSFLLEPCCWSPAMTEVTHPWTRVHRWQLGMILISLLIYLWVIQGFISLWWGNNRRQFHNDFVWLLCLSPFCLASLCCPQWKGH